MTEGAERGIQCADLRWMHRIKDATNLAVIFCEAATEFALRDAGIGEGKKQGKLCGDVRLDADRFASASAACLGQAPAGTNIGKERNAERIGGHAPCIGHAFALGIASGTSGKVTTTIPSVSPGSKAAG
jgi:hypothetical protein